MKDTERYEEFCQKVDKIRGAAVYDACDDDEDPYVELGIVTNDKIGKVKALIDNFGYKITDEGECCGSDYDSYCIWFRD